MKIKTKRFLSFALAFLMLVGCLPAGVWTTHVHAALANTLTGLSVSGLTVTYSNVTNIKGSSSWSGAGNSITGKATGYANFITTSSVSTTICFQNTSGSEATLSFDYVLENGGTVSTISGGKCSKVLAAGAELSVKLTSWSGWGTEPTTTSLEITNIKLVSTSAANATATFTPAAGGSYTVNGTQITAATSMTNAAGTDYVLVATPDNQKQFLGWYDETAGAYVGYTSTFTFSPTKDASVHPVFVDAATALFGVGAARFDDLNAAAAAAASGGDKTVFLVNNGTLAAGDYTIPAGVTLLIPFDDANTVLTEGTSIDQPGELLDFVTDGAGVYETPTAYRTLTMAPGAHVTVNGNLNVGGNHSHGNSSGQLTAGSPSGKVGMINMSAGSSIVLNNGANLHCWGFIYGGGTITAKSGATVHENFQFTDFRGGTCTSTMVGHLFVFPLSQYYVQNVEVAVTYEYGAKEKVWTSIYISSAVQSAGVDFIGEGAMFVPTEGGSIVKKYDPATDRLIIEINGGGSINSMSLKLGYTKINSQDFVLPINSNITVNINSGEVSVNQSIALLPGAKVTVAKNATLKISSSSESSSLYEGRENLFIYSADSWTHGINMGEYKNKKWNGDYQDTAAYFVHSGKRLSPVAYTPTRTKTRTEADLVDAVLDVNGTLVTDGFVYTANGMTAGGILSTAKTGKVIMNSGVGQDEYTYQANQGGSDGKQPIYFALGIISAQLRNSNGSYVATAVLGADDDGNTTITSTSCQKKWHYDAELDKWVAEHEYGSNGMCEECYHVNGYNGEDVYFAGWTLTLDGTIGMNYYVMLSDNFVNSPDAYILFTGVEKLNGEYKWTVNDDDRVKEGVNYFKITIPVCAYEMNKTITAEVNFADSTFKCEASVRNYAESMIAGNYTDTDKKFAAALLNYGAASQTYFSESEKRPELADDLANKNLGDEIDKTILDKSKLENYKKTPVTNDSIGTFKGFNLSLGSQTALRAYFDLANGVTAGDLEFTVNGKSATYEKGRIECAGINANELGNDIEFKVTLKSDNAKSLVFSCSAMSYCYSALESSNNNSLKVLVSALYRYYQASQIYYN